MSRDGPSVWGQIGRTLTSVRFLRAILALLGIALLVAFLIWIFERRHNDEFGGPTLKGLGSSMWWSAEMMTQASPGFGGPKTLPGRIVAVVWMAASIVVIAIFTAGVTTVLTTQKLQGLVQEVSDLSSVRVGATSGTATTEYLSARGIRYMGYATPQVGLKALQAGAIDAFVYDKPLLLWVVEQEFSNRSMSSTLISIRSPMRLLSKGRASSASPSTSQCSMPSRANGGSRASFTISANDRSIRFARSSVSEHRDKAIASAPDLC